MALGPRVVIIGNSGSGKSTLAQRLAQRIGASATDLDRNIPANPEIMEFPLSAFLTQSGRT